MPSQPEITRDAPRNFLGKLAYVGPALLIAASVVGSGELIGVPIIGALSGFTLAWLVLLGCLVKVPLQVEFGRLAVSSGVMPISAMSQVPGPRRKNVNWLVLYWLLMFIAGLAQLGGILQGVGQSLAISCPITGDYNELLAAQDEWDHRAVQTGKEQMPTARPAQRTKDDIYWSVLLGLATAVLLATGRYSLLEIASGLLVALFTGATIFCLVALFFKPEWALSWADVADGFTFRLPAVEGSKRSAVATALAALGIIGVGANEIVSYPMWCIAKGYARHTGPRDDSEAWAKRAKAWLNVMLLDAGVCFLIYTFVTMAFLALGATVLHRQGLVPESDQMIRTLSLMYVPVFGRAAQWIMLLGAFAVLYSTFLSATAGHARVAVNALEVYGLPFRGENQQRWWLRFFSIAFPLFALLVLLVIPLPVELILLSGVMQAVMLPMLAAAALYFRYRAIDKRIAPGRTWDTFLWLASLGSFIIGGWILWDRLCAFCIWLQLLVC